jgi:hypothetical protein
VTAREIPERLLAAKRRGAALRGFLRGLGLVLGPLMLACGLPYLACQTVCVPYRVLCERAGGDYFEIADVTHVCGVPSRVSPSDPCPRGFEPHASGDCSAVSLLPASCVSPFGW